LSFGGLFFCLGLSTGDYPSGMTSVSDARGTDRKLKRPESDDISNKNTEKQGGNELKKSRFRFRRMPEEKGDTFIEISVMGISHLKGVIHERDSQKREIRICQYNRGSKKLTEDKKNFVKGKGSAGN